MNPSAIWGADLRALVSQMGSDMLLYSGSSTRAFTAFTANMLGMPAAECAQVWVSSCASTSFAISYIADRKAPMSINDRGINSIKIHEYNGGRTKITATDTVCIGYKGALRDHVVCALDKLWDDHSDEIDTTAVATFISYGCENGRFNFENFLGILRDTKSKKHAQAIINIMELKKGDKYFQDMLIDLRRYADFGAAITNIATLIKS